VKNHVSSVITQRRLISAGINHVDFEQAQLITEYYEGAIPANEVKRVKALLDKVDEVGRPEFFNNLIMDRMKITPANVRDSKSIYSLNKVIADFIRYYKKANFDDPAWLVRQKELVDKNSIFQALHCLNHIITKLELDSEETAPQSLIQGGIKQ